MTLAKAEWAEVRTRFDEIIDLPTRSRADYLAKLSLPPHIAQQLQALLKAATTSGVLDGGVPGLEPDGMRPGFASLPQGTRVGAFEVDRLIGRGGMGEVYLAHRHDGGFAQSVALKLLRVEAADHGRMFERERRLLAGLEHPGIARLIDGGTAPDGRPFMAMDYVEGVPIDLYCRQQGLGLDARLDLFGAICAAVSYAHAKLVVHRDLKPSNIQIDQDGHPRLLDFGIATLLDDTALMPATTQAMLTPDYAAPEQLEGESASVVTDVFALGVVLFELMTGVGPWRREGNSTPSMIRRILYEDPPVPSKVAAATGGGAPVPPNRVAGDLDAIILKAMRRAPADRYQSVGELAADVRRHQELKPVLARLGSTSYLLGRFVRRYRFAVAAGVAALVAVLVGAAGIAWQARETAIERDIALAEARRSESITRMLTLMLGGSAQSAAGGDATVKQILDNTTAQLIDSLDNSASSATLITTLSDLYGKIEDASGADRLLQQALARGIGEGDPEATAQLRMRLASTAATLGRNDEITPNLDYAESAFGRDPERYRDEMVEINSGRAQMLRRDGNVLGAIALLRETLPDAEVAYAEDDRNLLTLYNNLLVYMVEANQMEEMPAVFAQADAALERTGQQASMQGLGITQLKGMRLLRLERPDDAARIFEQVARQRRASYGRSAGLAVDLLQLSRARMMTGRFAEAVTTLSDARPMAQEFVGPGALPTLVMGISLAEAKAETGDIAGAQALVAELTPQIDEVAGNAVPSGMLARARAVVAIRQGRWAEARQHVAAARAIFTELGAAGEPHLPGLRRLAQRIPRAS
ncbi:MAG: serine/threonine-protein kinase [Alteraurantiacibacter sp.]